MCGDEDANWICIDALVRVAHRRNTIARIAIAVDRAGTTRQQMLDSGKLIVPQCVTFHRKPPLNEASHETRFC